MSLDSYLMQSQCYAARGYTSLNPSHFKTKKYLFYQIIYGTYLYCTLFCIRIFYTCITYLLIICLSMWKMSLHRKFKIFEAIFFKNVYLICHHSQLRENSPALRRCHLNFRELTRRKNTFRYHLHLSFTTLV